MATLALNAFPRSTSSSSSPSHHDMAAAATTSSTTISSLHHLPISPHHHHQRLIATARTLTIAEPHHSTGSSSSSSRRIVTCQVALRYDSDSSSVAELEQEAANKVGSRVRVTAPLKVYHVPKVLEVDLTGKEGVIKQYVGVWKGKRISANLPFKVEFQAEVPERGLVKVIAHLREDEFEYIG